MSMQDTVADMFTRIRNAHTANKASVTMPHSNLKASIAQLLLDEGFIASFNQSDVTNGKSTLEIDLKYYEGKPVIEMLKRYSRPGLRQYRGKDSIPSVNQGLGVTIVSTSQGIMSDQSARKAGIGGEIIGYIA